MVLMDEVGSGTDPEEGAALAAALLERLSGKVALTYATSHHAQLKVRPWLPRPAGSPGRLPGCLFVGRISRSP